MEKEQDPICTDKKHNVRYWEGLDNLTEDYVETLQAQVFLKRDLGKKQ